MGWLAFTGGKPNYASDAAAAEARRQAQITYGTGLVNTVFGGGTTPVYTPLGQAPTKGQTYYDIGPQGKYQISKGNLGTQMDRYKSGNLYTMSTQTFPGFDQNFYNNLYNSYINYAMPQFQDQYRQTRNQIGFGLANRGLYSSGAAQNQWSDLARQTALGQQNIADTAQGTVNTMKQNLASAQNALINQVYQGADPAQAQAGAVQAAASLRQPSVFAPAINQFSNLLNSYYTSQLLNAYRQPQYYAPSTFSAPTSSQQYGWQPPTTLTGGQ